MADQAKLSSWHVGVAAEALAAAQFARCGYDVSVQYGANQPEYDLIVCKGERLLKVSVKGSQDGAWGLTQSYLKERDYQGAIATWEQRHNPRTVLCFVQLQGVALKDLPSLYLATPHEVAERLRATAKGRGDTTLYVEHVWASRAFAAGTVDKIPMDWVFTPQRVQTLMENAWTVA